jgi:predicted regulator of Ras-like GTPase activity (Roadblock/LC7/MglB family)
MPTGATSWSLAEADAEAIDRTLQRFLRETSARCALLVDRSGQLVTTAGNTPTFDATAFATLAAADFAANDQLARMLGEADFSNLYHQGRRESMYLADVSRRVIVIALFDDRTTLGLVRLKMKPVVEELTKLFEVIFARSGSAGGRLPALPKADDEIDALFNW